MTDIVIRVDNLSKRYRIGQQEPYKTLRDVLTNVFRNPFQRRYISSQFIWALKDVSFEVKQGEVIGIIGRNGAGKSTMLKLLSRITEPTEGYAEIHGRVGSLLEVGTGFHPELTGRENLYLNGAILGMKNAEIDKKFDEIVDFAEIGKFLDTPVKHYSSGMYVRLAFAVAAHLEPEILLVDEVLAVGDAAFQKKCLGKMGDVAKGGRTILFVSHNMAAIESLCTKGIVLENGERVFAGDKTEAIRYYLTSLKWDDSKDIRKVEKRGGSGNIRITKVDIEDDSGNRNVPFFAGSKLRFLISYHGKSEVHNPRLIIGLLDLMTTKVARFDTEVAGYIPSLLPASGQISCSTDAINLVAGRYYLNIAFLSNGEMQDYLQRQSFFDIVESNFFGTGRTFDEKETKVLIKHEWKTLP